MEILFIIGLLIYFGPALLCLGLVLFGFICSVEFLAVIGIVVGFYLLFYLCNKLNNHNDLNKNNFNKKDEN